MAPDLRKDFNNANNACVLHVAFYYKEKHLTLLILTLSDLRIHTQQITFVLK